MQPHRSVVAARGHVSPSLSWRELAAPHCEGATVLCPRAPPITPVEAAVRKGAALP